MHVMHNNIRMEKMTLQAALTYRAHNDSVDTAAGSFTCFTTATFLNVEEIWQTKHNNNVKYLHQWQCGRVPDL